MGSKFTFLLIAGILWILIPINTEAKSMTFGFAGISYLPEEKSKWLAGPELNFTYEKTEILINMAILNVEPNKTSFHFGVGTHWDLGNQFYMGFMGGLLFKHHEREVNTKGHAYDVMLNLNNWIPMSHRMILLPWLTIQKDWAINEEFSISVQGYINHKASHGSFGFKYNFE